MTRHSTGEGEDGFPLLTVVGKFPVGPPVHDFHDLVLELGEFGIGHPQPHLGDEGAERPALLFGLGLIGPAAHLVDLPFEVEGLGGVRDSLPRRIVGEVDGGPQELRRGAPPPSFTPVAGEFGASSISPAAASAFR